MSGCIQRLYHATFFEQDCAFLTDLEKEQALAVAQAPPDKEKVKTCVERLIHLLQEKDQTHLLERAGVNLKDLAEKKEPLKVRDIRVLKAAIDAERYPSDDPFSRVAAVAPNHLCLLYDLDRNVSYVEQPQNQQKQGWWSWWNSERTNEAKALNRLTLARFEKMCFERYGLWKTQDIFQRYHFDMEGMKERGDPLLVEHVRRFNIGVNDIELEDVKRLFCKLKDFYPLTPQVVTKHQELSQREKEGVLRVFSPDELEEMHNYRHQAVEHLPSALFNRLVSALRLPEDNWDLIFTGRKIHELITGMPSGFLDNFWHRQWQEDKEILQSHPQLRVMNEERYYEWLAKVGSKKELLKSEGDGLTWRSGHLLPAPDSPGGDPRWYRIAQIIDTGQGKFAYDLVPATSDYDHDMPDIRVYRSSSFYPAARDSYPCLVTDTNPIHPPGYYGQWAAIAQEAQMVRDASPRPLVLVGHSLGASHAQLALVNHFVKSDTPPTGRTIRLELFDAPALATHEAQLFKDWFERHGRPPISLTFHMSGDDIVPYVGWAHLGHGLDLDVAKVYVLHPSPESERQELMLYSHYRHYYSGQAGKDYRRDLMSVEEFDSGSFRYLVEVNRRLLGGVVCPLALALGSTSRFLWGRRGHRSGLSSLTENTLNALRAPALPHSPD